MTQSMQSILDKMDTNVTVETISKYGEEIRKDGLELFLEKQKEIQMVKNHEQLRVAASHLASKTDSINSLQVLQRGVPGCCDCTPLVVDPVNGVVINVPGKYALVGDVDFAPGVDDAIAIQILSDDVTIDLCNFTIRHSDASLRVVAILLGDLDQAVYSNIEIKNGSITDFRGAGIVAFNGTNDGVTSVPFTNLRFRNLNILRCQGGLYSAINFNTSFLPAPNDLDAPISYQNVRIEKCNVNNCVGGAAIFVYACDGLYIERTQANDLSTGGAFFGFAYDISYNRNIQIFNCQGNNLTGNGLVIQGGGIVPGDCLNLHIKNCQFNNTYIDISVIINSNMSNIINGLVENTQFNGTRAGPIALLVCGIHGSDGFEQTQQNNGVKYINCQFNDIVADPLILFTNEAPELTSALGFIQVTTRNMVFENCQATNIHGNHFYNAHGIQILISLEDVLPVVGNIRNIHLKNCIASDITGGKAANGLTCGSANVKSGASDEQGSLNNVTVEDCVASQIRGGSSSDTSIAVSGISDILLYRPGNDGIQHALYNFYVKNCRVSDVRSESEFENELSAGILMQAVRPQGPPKYGSGPEIINNSVADCDRGVLLTGSKVETGGLIPGFSNRGLIKGNEVSNCSVSGYQDDRCPSGSAWLSNTAFCNGERGKDNYRIKWSGDAPVAKGSLRCYPKPKYHTDNISISCHECRRH